MRKFLLLIFITISTLCFGQTEKEINEHVWKPFIKAQIDLDEKLYLSIHSPEIIRAERSNKKVYGYDVYAKNVHEGFQRALEAKKKGEDVKLSVELRFLERIASKEFAHEVGYYKSKLTLPSGKEVIYFSQFHVFLRKENGYWKILTDSSLPLPNLKEEDFQAAKSMDI